MNEPTRSTLEEHLLELAEGPIALRALRHLAGIAKSKATTGTTTSYLVALVRREAEATILAIQAGTLDRVVADRDVKPAKSDRWAIETRNQESALEADRARREARSVRVEACRSSLELLAPDHLARLWERAKRGVSPSRGLRRLGELVTNPLADEEARDAIALLMADEQEGRA